MQHNVLSEAPSGDYKKKVYPLQVLLMEATELHEYFLELEQRDSSQETSQQLQQTIKSMNFLRRHLLNHGNKMAEKNEGQHLDEITQKCCNINFLTGKPGYAFTRDKYISHLIDHKTETTALTYQRISRMNKSPEKTGPITSVGSVLHVMHKYLRPQYIIHSTISDDILQIIAGEAEPNKQTQNFNQYRSVLWRAVQEHHHANTFGNGITIIAEHQNYSSSPIITIKDSDIDPTQPKLTRILQENAVDILKYIIEHPQYKPQ